MHRPLHLLTAIQYWMSITHCMLCRNLMFWKTCCMIEGRLNSTMKGRKATLLQKGTLIVAYLEDCFIFCRNTLSWKKYCLALKENCSLWMKGLFEMKTFAKATLYLVDECLMMCMGAYRVACAAVSKWFGLLGCSSLSILFPLHRLLAIFTDFFGWWHLHVDEHLGKDIRHDDVYEELAPTTHCKTNRKTHSHSPRSQTKQLFRGSLNSLERT